MRHRYVVQRYVATPALYHGRKYHLRSFAVITADLQCFLHDTMFLIPAAQQYTLDPSSLANTHVHLTNAAINKGDPEFPGLIPLRLMDHDLDQWRKMLAACADLTQASAPFLKSQRSPDHFECLGLDFIPDAGAGGELWLIEANRMPGLSADGYPNSTEVNAVYDSLCRDIFNLLVRPAVERVGKGEDEGGAAVEGRSGAGSGSVARDGGSGAGAGGVVGVAGAGDGRRRADGADQLRHPWLADLSVSLR